VQASLARARRDLEDARERAAPLERERAAATEETRHLQERRTQAQHTLEELKKEVGFHVTLFPKQRTCLFNGNLLKLVVCGFHF
jgi:predicted nuclease with TOPRIM domain